MKADINDQIKVIRQNNSRDEEGKKKDRRNGKKKQFVNTNINDSYIEEADE